MVPDSDQFVEITDDHNRSKIVDFYNGRNVFITGGTGFLGKVVIEKLIRTCTGINKIYVLVRSKKGQSVSERLKSLIEGPLFEKLNEQILDEKLVAIVGDITKPGLAINDDDRNTLINEVSVVFHSAASVKFDDPLADCFKTNVLSTKYVLELCHQIKNIASFVHVSTAYAHCQRDRSDEILYPMKTSVQQLEKTLESIDENEAKVICKDLLDGRPNTYTLTKALAEHYINDHKGNLPVAIIRPSIITSVFKDPLPGWTDSVNGPAGVILLGSLGIARTMHFDPKRICDFIPVDIVSNAMIIASEHVAMNRDGQNEMKIYNVTSGSINPLNFYEFLISCRQSAVKYPSIRMIRLPRTVPKEKENMFTHFYIKYIEELLFAYIVDIILNLIGNKSKLSVVRVVKKMHNGFKLLEFFSQRQWTMPSTNIMNVYRNLNDQDRELFYMDVDKINWKEYLNDFYLGLRRYILKESDSNLDAARSWMNKLKNIYQFLNAITIFGLLFYTVKLIMKTGLIDGNFFRDIFNFNGTSITPFYPFYDQFT